LPGGVDQGLMGKHGIAIPGGRQEKLKKKEERDRRGIHAKPVRELTVARRAAQEFFPGKYRVASIASV
jgi:hypothetical protein